MELTRPAATAAAFLLDVLLRSLIVFLAAGLACLAMRRASAAARHLLWAATLGGLLLLPALCALLPRWDAPVLPSAVRPSLVEIPSGEPAAPHHGQMAAQLPTATGQYAASEPHKTLPSTHNSKTTSDGKTPDASTPRPTTGTDSAGPEMPVSAAPPLIQARTAHFSIPPRPTAAEWLCVVWLLGFLAVLSRTVLGLLRAVRLVRRSSPMTSAPVAAATEEARRILGLRSPLSIREGGPAAPVAVPMTFGVLRPVVLLPEGAGEWPAERLRVVMTHEAAHVMRLDWGTTMLSRSVCALYWFHPFVWLATRRLTVEAEAACDDLVLAHGVTAPDYAAHLLEVVRGLAGRRVPSAAVTMAYSHEIRVRLNTILAERRNRRAATGRGIALAAVTALSLVVPLAALRPVSAVVVAAQQDRPPQETIPPDLAREGQWFRALRASDASPWKATLPDGTRVYLVGLWALNGADADKHWTPDGRILAEGEGRSTPYYRRFRSTVCNIDVTLGFTSDALRRQARVAFAKIGERPDEGTDLAKYNGNGYYMGSERMIDTGFQRSFAPSLGKTTLVVSVATGPEATLVSGPPERGATVRLPTGETVAVSRAAVRPSSASGGQGDTTRVVFSVPSRFVRDQSEYRVSVLGLDGRPLRFPGGSQSYPVFTGDTATVAYSFLTGKLPISRIKAFRLTYRHAKRVTFHNVALCPVTSHVAPSVQRSAVAGDATNPPLPNSIASTSGDSGAALPAQIASALAGDASWRRTLRNGIQVKLVSVTSLDEHYQPGGSWKPDGMPLGTRAAAQPDPVPPPHLSYQFLVVFPNETMLHEAYLAYGRAGSLGVAEGEPGWRRQRWAVLNYPESEAAPQPQQRVALRVNIATGPETTLVSGPPLTGAVRRLPMGETVVLSKAILHSPGEAHQDGHPVDTTEVDFTLPTRFVHDMSEYRFLIIGQDGKPLSAQHAGGGVPIVSGRTAQMRYDFRSAEVPLARVKEFRLTFRQSETAVFKNFAVRPNHAAPSPTGSSSASSQAVPSADRAQVAQGASLQLMAVSDKPSDVHRWWRPDGTPFVYDWRQFRSRFEPSHQQTPFQQWPVLMFRVSQPAGGDADVEAWNSPVPRVRAAIRMWRSTSVGSTAWARSEA